MVPISAVPSLSVGPAVPSSLLRPGSPFNGAVISDYTGASLAVEGSPASAPRRSMRQTVRPSPSISTDHRPVRDRWFYEPVVPVLLTGLADATHGSKNSAQGALSNHVIIRGPPPFLSPADSEQSSGEHLVSLPSQRPTPWFLRLSSAGPTGRFAIRLVFPGGELGAQLFMVTTSMSVLTLVRAVAQMMQVPPPVFLYVAPEWAPLDHHGFIVDRFLPGTDTPCPFLHPGSLLRVFRHATENPGAHLANPGVRLDSLPAFSSPSAIPASVSGLASPSRLDRLAVFSSSAESLTFIGRPMKNGKGGASMTASEAALYDDNTLRRMDEVDRHNLTVGDSGFSSHNLVFGEGSSSVPSSVQFEELPDSPQEQEDRSPERDDSPARTSTGTASSSDGPPTETIAVG
jgi:hypothetical protein